jgi:hypothetical protein
LVHGEGAACKRSRNKATVETSGAAASSTTQAAPNGLSSELASGEKRDTMRTTELCVSEPPPFGRVHAAAGPRPVISDVPSVPY